MCDGGVRIVPKNKLAGKDNESGSGSPETGWGEPVLSEIPETLHSLIRLCGDGVWSATGGMPRKNFSLFFLTEAWGEKRNDCFQSLALLNPLSLRTSPLSRGVTEKAGMRVLNLSLLCPPTRGMSPSFGRQRIQRRRKKRKRVL